MSKALTAIAVDKLKAEAKPLRNAGWRPTGLAGGRFSERQKVFHRPLSLRRHQKKTDARRHHPGGCTQGRSGGALRSARRARSGRSEKGHEGEGR